MMLEEGLISKAEHDDVKEEHLATLKRLDAGKGAGNENPPTAAADAGDSAQQHHRPPGEGAF